MFTAFIQNMILILDIYVSVFLFFLELLRYVFLFCFVCVRVFISNHFSKIQTSVQIERARARNLPIYLHARRITLPDIIPDKKLAITAAKPHFFTKTQQTLKLRDTELKY